MSFAGGLFAAMGFGVTGAILVFVAAIPYVQARFSKAIVACAVMLLGGGVTAGYVYGAWVVEPHIKANTRVLHERVDAAFQADVAAGRRLSSGAYVARCITENGKFYHVVGEIALPRTEPCP